LNPLSQAEDLLQRGDLQQAEKLYRSILATQPNNGVALWGLGRIAMQVKHYTGAIAMLSRAAAALPSQAAPLQLLAQALQNSGRHTEAGTAYRLALKAEPDNARAHCELGVWLAGSGQLAAAEAALREALERDRYYAPAWLSLSRLKHFASGDPDISALQQALAHQSGSVSASTALHYALGKARHDCGNFSQAFDHWRYANELDHQRASFSVADMRPFFDSLKSQFDEPALARKAQGPKPALTPVFIVGQPRSGSTLLESMLAGHSRLETAGEQHYLAEDVAAALHQQTGAHFPEGLASLSPQQLRALGEVYLQGLQQHAPAARMIIDKLPANYQSIGLIYKILPHAKIIHLRRHPLDLGFSIFRNYFAAPEPYFSSLPEIAAYHREYESVMAHWRRLLPGFVHELCYEDLLRDPEVQLSAALAHCDLQWEPACLEFRQASHHINTLSQAQVRAPLNLGAVGSWKPYAAQLAPLREALGDCVQRYESALPR
jgi:tetratricopeptide (TPR) repeat protein